MANDDNNAKGESFWAYLGKYIIIPVTVAVITATLTAYIAASMSLVTDREQKRWELKREAGLRALQIIDQYYANNAALGQISGMRKVSFQFEPMNLKEVREVYDELTVVCDDTNAPAIYLEILSSGRSEGEKAISLDRIVDLQNSIRKELGFGQSLERDRKLVWIADLFVNTNGNIPSTENK